jgi:hypothetical protein
VIRCILVDGGALDTEDTFDLSAIPHLWLHGKRWVGTNAFGQRQYDEVEEEFSGRYVVRCWKLPEVD